jgi:hypothetical protein
MTGSNIVTSLHMHVVHFLTVKFLPVLSCRRGTYGWVVLVASIVSYEAKQIYYS